MMKSFFKKLAFVMALAMVVTLAAPAAQSASAAEAMYLAYQAGGKVTELNMRVGDAEDLCFKKAPANWATLSKKWSSNNEAVAIVDKNGVVTALADGTATITFALGDGTAASVNVTVGDIKPYDVTLGNADNKTMTALELKVGTAFDLNFYGVKDWASSKYSVVWISDMPEVAKVDQKGNVAAVSAGTATITAAIVNDKTGVTMNVTPVVVTVPAEVVVPQFTMTQVDTVTVKLNFDEATDLSEVTVEDFEVTAIDDTFEYTLFANTAVVDKNVVTLTFVEGILTDGAVIKVGYKGGESVLVASNGDVVKAVVSYGMTDKYTGDAYVYTELDPDYVRLAYKLYDKNDIDVTANFTENEDYAIEWVLTDGSDYASEPEEDAENGWQMSFDEKGAATVQVVLTFTNEDGEDREVKSAATKIVAKDRPEIKFDYEEAGLVDMMGSKANEIAVVESFNKWDGTIWGADKYSTSIQKGKTAWFGARLTDNRGDGLVSTFLTHDRAGTLNAKGDTEYFDYGYFVYESSNEDVLDIDSDGCVTGVEVGSATILVSFVRYTEDGEEMDPVKVCSRRISVTTDYPDPYAKTFEFIKDSLTVTSTGDSVNATAYVKFYDQYGHVYDTFKADDLNAYSVVTIPATYETATFTFGEKVKNNDTGKQYAYPVAISGEELSSLVDIKDNGYSVFKFTLEFDKDIEEFSKIVTKSDKLSVKVYNVDAYYEKLTDFFYGATQSALDTEYAKWNYVIDGGASVNVYVDKRTEFDSGSADETPSKTIKVTLNSAAGLKLMNLPEDYFIRLTDKVDDINKNTDLQKKLVEGAIYYQLSYPSKVDMNTVHVATEGAVTYTFNKVDGKEIKLATPGSYSVSMYYVNSKNKLVKLGSGTTSINVTNTTPAVKAEGFIKTNVYEDGAIIANYDKELHDTYDADVIKALKYMYNFTWNGELLYDAKRDVMSDNFDIVDVDYEYHDDKVVVTKIYFALDYFNNCAKDGKGGVDNDASELFQKVELKKRITLKFD